MYVTNAEVKENYPIIFLEQQKITRILIKNVFKNIIWYLVAELFGSI